MTLVLGYLAGNEAYFGTDTLVRFPDGRREHIQKYKILSDLGVAIFPRGSEHFTTKWIKEFKGYLGEQSLTDFFKTGYKAPLKNLVPTYNEALSKNLIPKGTTKETYYRCTEVELFHCFFDADNNFRCEFLVNYDAGNNFFHVNVTEKSFFSRPRLDTSFTGNKFSENFIEDTLIPSAKLIKSQDDKADIKAVIGGELEVLYFSDSKIIPIGSVYSFNND